MMVPFLLAEAFFFVPSPAIQRELPLFPVVVAYTEVTLVFFLGGNNFIFPGPLFLFPSADLFLIPRQTGSLRGWRF